MDGGKVALCVLGKSYCAVLLPFRALGIEQHELPLDNAGNGSCIGVPAGEMRGKSVLVEAYSSMRSRGTRQSALAGVVPPAAVLRLRRKDASLIRLRCVGDTAHVFMSESRVTVLVARGTWESVDGSNAGSSSSKSTGPSVPMSDDPAIADGGSSGRVPGTERSSAHILSWSLTELSSEFNGNGPQDASISPWQGYGDRDQKEGRDVSSLSRRAQRRQGVSRRQIKAREAVSGAGASNGPPAAKGSKKSHSAAAALEATERFKANTVAFALESSGVPWHPSVIRSDYPRAFV